MTNHDFGLDALHVFPSGEIWFSAEESFTDQRLGSIQAGDLLSNNGYIVFRNRSLLAAFAPTEPTQDYGLDALFVVTDTQPSRPCPRIIGQTSFGNHLEWDGDGEVFQFKHATSPGGPWVPCTEVLADLSCDIDTDVTANTVHFYRLRQW